MKSFTSLPVGLLAMASQASCHYIFQQLTHAGTEYPVYQYIRKNTNYNSPVTDLTSNDLRCNVGGESGADTETITMAAGDSFTFTTDVTVYHDGPLSIYMAQAPAAAADFDGSGQVWFKILDLGPTFDASGNADWPLSQTYTYTIPTALPSGDYLLRVQQLGIHNPYPAGTPQFYISCAQVTVTGGGDGVPGPLVSIPGFITGTEPGYTVNIYNGLKNYTAPGPAVWTGQNDGGSAGTGTPVNVPPVVVPQNPDPVQSAAPPVVADPDAPTASKYGQCGGQGWTGPTACEAGSTCVSNSQYYSQCL